MFYVFVVSYKYLDHLKHWKKVIYQSKIFWFDFVSANLSYIFTIVTLRFDRKEFISQPNATSSFDSWWNEKQAIKQEVKVQLARVINARTDSCAFSTVE